MKRIAALLPDFAGLLGFASLSFGAGLVYRPAGFITAGILLLAGSVLFAIGQRKGRE